MLPIGLLAVSALASAASLWWLQRRAARIERTSSQLLAAVVLVRRLLIDRRVGRRPKILLAAAVAYQASPLQLIPNFVPVLGQLDNILVLMVCLHLARRSVPSGLLAELWPAETTPGTRLHSRPWHRFHFLPLPQVQGSFRPRDASSEA